MTTTFLSAWYIAATILFCAMTCLRYSITEDGLVKWINIIGVLSALILLVTFIKEQYF